MRCSLYCRGAVLNKRKAFKKAFDNFDLKKIALYTDEDVSVLLSKKDIIRNRRKIESVINNANALLGVKKEFGTFDSYVWSFTSYKTSKNSFRNGRKYLQLQRNQKR